MRPPQSLCRSSCCCHEGAWSCSSAGGMPMLAALGECPGLGQIWEDQDREISRGPALSLWQEILPWMLQTQGVGFSCPPPSSLSPTLWSKYISPVTDALGSCLGSEAAAPSWPLPPQPVHGCSWMYFVLLFPPFCSSTPLMYRPGSLSSCLGKEGYVC